MIYELRPARETDAKQIQDLINLVGINPMGLNWTRFIVAVNERGEIIGCGQIKPHGGEIREMASIAAHPKHRGQGIARAVIERLMKENPKPLYLMCLSHNGALYEKFGFRPLAEENLPRYFSRVQKLFNLTNAFRKSGEELLVMKLE